jgi:tetratricopeptide (TPR) repeat protein
MTSQDRLDSWKEIAAYLKRGVRTVQRWERVARLPVRRIGPDRGAVYAFRSELDAWWLTQAADVRGESDGSAMQRAVARTVADQLRAASAEPIGGSSPGDGSMRVREFLSPGMAIDPESALAHAHLAIYFFTLVAVGLLRPSEGMPAARAAAQRATDLDASMKDAHAVSAIVAGLYAHDWHDAQRRFGAALQEPIPPSVRFHHATWYLSPLGRHEEALAELQRGLADEPLYLLGRVQVGMELCSLGQQAPGLAEVERVLGIDSGFGPALGLLGREYAIAGRVDEALALAKRTCAAIPRHPNAVGFLAGMLRRTGHAEQARHLIQSFALDNAWSRSRARAECAVVCGEFETAVESLKAATDEGDPGVWLLFTGTAGNRLRSAGNWPTLRAKLNLPQP